MLAFAFKGATLPLGILLIQIAFMTVEKLIYLHI
jgi:hypothetical protein